MKIKLFNIRLDKENFEKDQEKINLFLENVVFKKSSASFVESNINFWSVLVHYEEENQIEPSENKVDSTYESLTEDEQKIFDYFKQWRFDKATQENIPAFMILTNKTIISIAKIKPETIEDLDKVHGIGKNKKKEYGDTIIALMNTI